MHVVREEVVSGGCWWSLEAVWVSSLSSSCYSFSSSSPEHSPSLASTSACLVHTSTIWCVKIFRERWKRTWRRDELCGTASVSWRSACGCGGRAMESLMEVYSVDVCVLKRKSAFHALIRRPTTVRDLPDAHSTANKSTPTFLVL